MKTAAIYARVSSDRQKEEQTIDSQISALIEFADREGCVVPEEWIFKDEGYSGSILERPGLERLRDLASEGQPEAVLIYSPDRLTRNYAYHVLLLEEFARNGVEIVFKKAPRGDSPEDQLLLQVQGIIAEYERTQIRERTRRGRLHRARQGSVSVMSQAPYGFKYHKKTSIRDAFYEIIENEAEVVRLIFRLFTEEGKSIAGVTRTLNQKGIQTRTGKSPWERSTVWGILRNPAHKGMAAYGKTEKTSRQKVTRRLRQRGGWSPNDSGRRWKAPEEWHLIPVPAIVSEETFELAGELLLQNKRLAERNAKRPTLLRGLVICGECGYAFHRRDTYYRCIGSRGDRHHNGAVCNQRGIREDELNNLVWKKILELLSTPDLIQKEIEKRKEQTLNTHPAQKRKETLCKEIARAQKGIDKLLDAYQDSLLSLSELRKRIPDLRRRSKTLEAELTSIEATELDTHTLRQLQETVESFQKRLHESAKNLDIKERQKILQLLIKEILVYKNKIIIKHSIPVSNSSKTPFDKKLSLCTGLHAIPLG